MKNGILLLYSLLIALFGAEIYLRISPPEWLYMELRNVVQQTHSEPANQGRGYIPRANLSQIFTNREFKTMVQINSKNLRDQEYSTEKLTSKKRILAFGDSFVFGWGVENNETTTEILEQKYLNGVEVLNFGVSGYCAGQQLARLKAEGLSYQPDIVLFFMYSLPSECSDKYTFYQGRMYWENPQDYSPWEWWQYRILRKSYFATFLSGSYYDLRSKFQIYRENLSSKPNLHPAGIINQPDDMELENSKKILDELLHLSKQNSFKLILIYIPDKYHFRNHNDTYEIVGTRFLETYAVNEGIGFIDLGIHPHDLWEKTGNYPYFKHDDHWNIYGHQYAAKTILDFLKDNHFLEDLNFKIHD